MVAMQKDKGDKKVPSKGTDTVPGAGGTPGATAPVGLRSCWRCVPQHRDPMVHCALGFGRAGCEHAFSARCVLHLQLGKKVHQKDSGDSARAFRLSVFFARFVATASGLV